MTRRLALLAIALVALVAGCGDAPGEGDSGGDGPTGAERALAERLGEGTVRTAGPAVLRPLLGSAASNFEGETDVEIDVGRESTERAFDRLCSGRLDLAGARRPMTAAEQRACEASGIDLQRLKIANHAVAVAANEELGIDCLTLDQLEQLWRPGSDVSSYRELEPALPDAQPLLYGPEAGTDSFALFTSIVNGREGAIRESYAPVANRSELVARVEGSQRALGFANVAQLRPATEVDLVAVDGGDGCVEPTTAAVQSGSYPIAEELYVYVSGRALERDPRVRSFARYLLVDYPQLAGVSPPIVPATEDEIDEGLSELPAAPTPAG